MNLEQLRADLKEAKDETWLRDGGCVYALRDRENSWQAQFSQDGRRHTPLAEVFAKARLAQQAPDLARKVLEQAAMLERMAKICHELSLMPSGSEDTQNTEKSSLPQYGDEYETLAEELFAAYHDYMTKASTHGERQKYPKKSAATISLLLARDLSRETSETGSAGLGDNPKPQS